jgi:glycosyltransferase involved in cell wall biosynthesis
MRLAVYTDYSYRSDGEAVYGERAFVLFLSELRGLVDDLVLVGRLDPEPGRSHYRLRSEVRFVGLPYYASLTHPLAVLGALAGSIRRFWRVLDDVDTVWLLGPYPTSISFVALAAVRRRRIVLGVRQEMLAYTRRRHPGRRWLHLAAGALEVAWRLLARRFPIIVVGPRLAEQYARSRAVLPIAVSLTRAADVAAPGTVSSSPPGSPIRVLSVGRLDREKNPLLLAEVLARLPADERPWRLVVCGEGPMREELEQRLGELGMREQCEFLGYVPLDGGLADVYRSCDVLLHVSWTEGYPQVLVEAFAAGLPVVATAVGGVPDAVGEAALLIPPGDAAAAADALERIASDPALRAALARAGVARAGVQTLEAETTRVVRFLRNARGLAEAPGRAEG